jgi:OmpA-OmpF porin, OOP family
MTSIRSLAFVLALAPLSASAQSFPEDDFSAIRFYVSPGGGNYLMVEGAETSPDLMPSIGATFDYAHHPFVADDLDCFTGNRTMGCETPMNQESDLLDHVLNLQIYGAISFLERIQIGLNIPVLLYFDGEAYSYVDRTTREPHTPAIGGASASLADPRLTAKIRILDPGADGNGFTFAIGIWGTAPIGHLIWPGHFIGDVYPTGGGHLIGGLRFDAFRLALNVGAQARAEAVNVRSVVGTEMTFGLAAAYRFDPLVEAMVEVTGATSFGTRFDSEAPIELRAAAFFHASDLHFHVGGGVGLFYGVGVPVFRVFAGGTFDPSADRDSDSDGLADSQDSCPTDAEDPDEYDDEDGCPEVDNDEDRIVDGQDQCPAEAEDSDEFEDDDGCPEADNDEDGVNDGYDSCPNVAEDRDGDRDEDGCPDQDQDEDGIVDDADTCDDRAEDFDGLADEDGCPEEDVDGDGVPDESDECPEQAGPRRRGNGCPRP